MDELSPIIALVITGILTPIIVGWFNMRYEVSMKRALAAIEQGQRDADAKRDAARAEAQAERERSEREREEDVEWRASVDARLMSQEEWNADRAEWYEWRAQMEGSFAAIDDKLDKIRDGTQTTMRTDLIHLYEKYVTRGWITPEEKAAWFDMHKKYSSLDANGLIDSYKVKLEAIPEMEID